MKNIAIIGTVGIPAKYGGFETLTEYLVDDLSTKYNFTVYCSSKNYNEKLSNYNGARLKYLPLKANGIQSIPYDMLSMILASKKNDTLLILGVSGCILLPIIKFFSNTKIIVNIDGLEWKRDKWNKYAKIFLKFSEKIAVQYADDVVTDNLEIQKHVKLEYLKQSSLIPYGADHVQKLSLEKEVLNNYPYLEKEYAVTVCRIEPENNVEMILEAFSKYKNLVIVFVGNWDNSEYGKKLKMKFNIYENIKILDPIYNQNILNQIRSNAKLYIHGHSAGGTNPSLVEAMYLRLCIFAYDIGYNKETTEHKAKYFTDSENLGLLLSSIEEDEKINISNYMYEIASRRYRWKVVADQYSLIF